MHPKMTLGNQRTKACNNLSLATMSAKNAHKGQRCDNDSVARTMPSPRPRASRRCNNGQHDVKRCHNKGGEPQRSATVLSTIWKDVVTRTMPLQGQRFLTRCKGAKHDDE